MDKEKTFAWLWGIVSPSLVRGLLWLLSGYLGLEASKAQDTTNQIMLALGTIVPALLSLLWSRSDKAKALNTASPDQSETINFLQKKLAEAHEKLELK